MSRRSNCEISPQKISSQLASVAVKQVLYVWKYLEYLSRCGDLFFFLFCSLSYQVFFWLGIPWYQMYNFTTHICTMIYDLKRSVHLKMIVWSGATFILDDLVKLNNPVIFQEFEKNKNMTSSSLQSAVIEVSLIKLNLLKTPLSKIDCVYSGFASVRFFVQPSTAARNYLQRVQVFSFFLSLLLLLHGIIIKLHQRHEENSEICNLLDVSKVAYLQENSEEVENKN